MRGISVERLSRGTRVGNLGIQKHAILDLRLESTLYSYSLRIIPRVYIKIHEHSSSFVNSYASEHNL